MKITETITRDCCEQKDLRPVEGCRKFGMHPEFKFCVHCGARHEYHRFTDPAGGTDSEYRKVREDAKVVAA